MLTSVLLAIKSQPIQSRATKKETVFRLNLFDKMQNGIQNEKYMKKKNVKERKRTNNTKKKAKIKERTC